MRVLGLVLFAYAIVAVVAIPLLGSWLARRDERREANEPAPCETCERLRGDICQLVACGLVGPGSPAERALIELEDHLLADHPGHADVRREEMADAAAEFLAQQVRDG